MTIVCPFSLFSNCLLPPLTFLAFASLSALPLSLHPPRLPLISYLHLHQNQHKSFNILLNSRVEEAAHPEYTEAVVRYMHTKEVDR